MAAGDPFSATERAALDAAIRKAEQLSRAEFSVFVGKAEGEPRAFATRLHNSLVAPARSVLIMVDPTARAIEVVTGEFVRRTLSDSEVELAIQEQLLDLMQGKTVIAIAHRLSTIARMDRLVVLEAGRVVEEGTHEELLRYRGHYEKLWRHQSGGFIANELDDRDEPPKSAVG